MRRGRGNCWHPGPAGYLSRRTASVPLHSRIALQEFDAQKYCEFLRTLSDEALIKQCLTKSPSITASNVIEVKAVLITRN
jgi:hypothetical protein